MDKIEAPLKKYKVGSKFGWRIHPITKVKSFHNGVDLSAPQGTPIYAPKSGKIAKKYFNDIGGNQLIISHGNLQTGYAHLSGYADDLKVGDMVKTGDIVGYVGNTGQSTGPHLHFTCRINNKLVDPLTLI